MLSHHKLTDEDIDRYGSASSDDTTEVVVLETAKPNRSSTDDKKTIEKKATITDVPSSPISRNRHSQSPSGSRQTTGVDANKQSLSDLVDLEDVGRNSLSVNIVDPFSELDKELHSIGLSPRGPMVIVPDTPTRDPRDLHDSREETHHTVNSISLNPITQSEHAHVVDAPISMSAIDVLQHNVLNRYYKKDLLQDKYSKSTTDLEWDEMNPARAAQAAANNHSLDGSGVKKKGDKDGARIQLHSATDDTGDTKADSDLKQAKTGCCIIL